MLLLAILFSSICIKLENGNLSKKCQNSNVTSHSHVASFNFIQMNIYTPCQMNGTGFSLKISHSINKVEKKLKNPSWYLGRLVKVVTWTHNVLLFIFLLRIKMRVSTVKWLYILKVNFNTKLLKFDHFCLISVKFIRNAS